MGNNIFEVVVDGEASVKVSSVKAVAVVAYGFRLVVIVSDIKATVVTRFEFVCNTDDNDFVLLESAEIDETDENEFTNSVLKTVSVVGATLNFLTALVNVVAEVLVNRSELNAILVTEGFVVVVSNVKLILLVVVMGIFLFAPLKYFVVVQISDFV